MRSVGNSIVSRSVCARLCFTGLGIWIPLRVNFVEFDNLKEQDAII
jgi:hypothetical protein